VQLQAVDEYGVLPTVEEPAGSSTHSEAAPEPQAVAPIAPPPPATMDELLNDDFFKLPEQQTHDMFKLKHVAVKVEPAVPDYVAQRRPCKDFAQFQPLLETCQADLKHGRRRLIGFAKEQQIEIGKFFTLRGVLLQVVAIAAPAKSADGRDNPRLRCIFENGTECDMLARSLEASLYKDGRRITELAEDLLKNMRVTPDDQASGFIYVLRSLSTRPEVRAVPNLHKIGLARTSIENRIKDAANDPTYLLADVALVATFKTFNMNLPKLENLLHRFFDKAAAKIQVKDKSGNFTTPKEWFSVPLEAIEQAVDLLVTGEILNFAYDPVSEKITPRG
jgi:hypothetical protein